MKPETFLSFTSRGEVTEAEHLLSSKIWPAQDNDGFGHIDAPQGLTHPALPGEVIRRVPVVPPRARPLREMPGGALMPDPIGRAYIRFLRKQQMMTRLIELEAPAIILDATREALQRLFEELLSALDGAPRDRWQPVDPAALHFEVPGESEAKVWSCAFLGEDVVVADGKVVTRMAAGGVVAHWPAPGAVIQATREPHVLFRHAELVLHHLLDTASGRWLSEPTDGFPAGLMFEEDEVAHVVDVAGAREQVADDLADYPVLNLASPDGRFLWIADKQGNGGIYQVATGQRVAEPDLRGEDEDDDDEDEEALAFALASEWRFACSRRVLDLYGNMLFDLKKVVRRRPRALAFDHAGARLVAVVGREVIVIELDGPRVAWRGRI